jgi:uncharacterized protein YjbJ (UPF0337 family)
MNKDQFKGRVNVAHGNVKEIFGKLVDNMSLQVQGKMQKSLGKMQTIYGNFNEDIKYCITRLG